mgnify:CR=1 FL=1
MWKKYTIPGEPKEVEGFVPKYTIEGTEVPGGITTAFVSAPTPTISNSSTTDGLNGGNKGNKGGNKRSAEKKTKDKEFGRY